MNRSLAAPGAAGAPEAASPPPDVETSSESYARRFSGAVGAWFLEAQADLTLALIARWPRARVLDVGGGHAQLTGPLVDAGYDVTVYGSEPGCAARLRPWLDGGRVRFQAGRLDRLDVGDRAFDVVVCYRLLPHVERWRELLGELCRIARAAVLVDYPTRRSLNAVAGPLFAVKRGVEGDTRPFTVFADGDVRAALDAAGFAVTARRGEFVLPMALHRAVGLAPLSRAAEGLLALFGLRRALGSPVILRAERRDGFAATNRLRGCTAATNRLRG
jgi:2-polyprenyl-3-methyl-5-hydroxy-6-metoxy-1,4-benzoquinol methylase